MIGQVKPCSTSPDPVGATVGATVTSSSDTIMEEEEQSTDMSHHTEQVCVLTLAAWSVVVDRELSPVLAQGSTTTGSLTVGSSQKGWPGQEKWERQLVL